MTFSLFDLSDEEAEAARSGIIFHQREIALLDTKIASLLGAVDSLRKIKEDHQDKIRLCESVLTLARRLPPELLGQIFEHCVYLYPPAPLILSQVCSAWRAAAHSTPRIWSLLFIDCARPRSAERTAHWVAMSGSHIPLQIVLLPHDISLHPVMCALVPHSDRWKSFTVDAVLPSHAREVLEIIRARECQLSVLTTLDVTVHEDMDQTFDMRRTFTDKLSLRLRTVRLQSGSWPMAILPNHITALSLAMPVLWLPTGIHSQIIQLLRTLSQLQSFSLEFPDGSFPRETPDSVGDVMLIMEHLQTVILTGCHSLFEILAHLTLPSLCHLGLRETGKDLSQTPIGPFFLEMIARSSPPIKTLELHGIDANDSDFVRCFIYLTTLEELILHDSEISNAVFRRFCFPVLIEDLSVSPWICPRLGRLDLRWCSQLSGRVLAELVEARLASPQTSNISEVVVINCSSVREDDVMSLAAITFCRLKNRTEDFCYHRGCCINNRYRHRFVLRHAAELQEVRRERGGVDL